MKQFLKLFIFFLVLNFTYSNHLIAQDYMHINMADGTLMEILLDDIQMLTFEDDKGDNLDVIFSGVKGDEREMILYYSDGSNENILLGEIQKLTFTPHVGINEMWDLEKGLYIYPNPCKNSFNAKGILDLKSRVSIKIYSTGGLEMLNQDLGVMKEGTYNFTIDVEGFHSGIYVVELQVSDQTFRKRLIVL